MKHLIAFALGAALATALAQQNSSDRPAVLNHVGVATSDFQRSLDFYTNTLGLREAFVLRDEKGQPALAYLQVSRNSFVELFPPSATRASGIVHLALEVADMKAIVARLREKGTKVEEPRIGRTKALLTFFTDPDGNRIELLEFGSEALQRKAAEKWQGK